jgi:Rrf2 family nitric oxide-sensitive transcriptional repressor
MFFTAPAKSTTALLTSAMRLTTFTDYSLRMLIYVAALRGGRATIAEISLAFGVSENHLIKVAHFLGKGGLLANVRGRGGGLELARPAAQIKLGTVVRMTEQGDMPAECFDFQSNTCVLTPHCRLRGVLHDAVTAFYAVLDQHSLEDLVRNRAALSRALFRDAAPEKSTRS